MKKIICIVLVLSLLCITAFANNLQLSKDTKKDLFDFGIMIGDENGDLHLEDKITYGEFCKVICASLGYADVSELTLPFTENFKDTNHWAYKYIRLANEFSLVDGTLDADKSITAEYAIKVMISMLGYEKMVRYTDDYVKIASQIGLLNNVKLNIKEEVTRYTIANIIYNSLDIPLMQQTSYGKSAEFTIMNGIDGIPLVTLRTKLLSK